MITKRMMRLVSNSMRCIARYTPGHWVSLLYLRCSGRDLVKTGGCRCCGSCCTNINLKAGRVWLRSEETFNQLKERNPDYERFVISGSDHQGYLRFTCSWLMHDGTCRNYEQRLPVCRSFPTKSLVLCGGTLPPGCGYSIVSAVPFDKRLKQAAKQHARHKDSPD